MYQFENIPLEMRKQIAWVLWRYELRQGQDKPTKPPYNAKTGKLASVDDEQTWSSFEEVVSVYLANQSIWSGIGFMLSKRDPYFVIDLDDTAKFPPEQRDEIANRYNKIINDIGETYIEVSPSRNGLHIFGRGQTPDGRRRDGVELYSDRRFITMTGWVYRNSPIANRQEFATNLHSELKPVITKSTTGFIGSLSQDYEDQEVFDKARAASNGDKFLDLWNGNWQQYYSSQSEADFALIDILAYYTTFIPQLYRMFRSSALGQREKANRDKYVSDMIERSFDNRFVPTDPGALEQRLQKAIAEAAEVKKISGHAPSSTAIPPEPHYQTPIDQWPLDAWRTSPGGILDSIATYIYRSSPLPLYETALVGAIGMFAGLVGRQWNVSGTGLNIYIMFLAHTGHGKEAIQTGITRIVNTVSSQYPFFKDILGPAEIASGQALLKHLGERHESPCFVSLLGEIGLRIQKLTEPNASAADRTLMRVLLDLFGKSGAGSSVLPSIYADNQKNSAVVHSPSYSIIGEGVPDKFYEALDEDAVISGLLPRFLIIEYTGHRVDFNYSHASIEFPETLNQQLQSLMRYRDEASHRGVVFDIPLDNEADQMRRQLDSYCQRIINNQNTEMTRHIWNRVSLNIQKLAGMVAISRNYQSPQVTGQDMQWAASLVLSSAKRLMDKFNAGEMGNDVTDLTHIENKMKAFLAEYVSTPYEKLKLKDTTPQMREKFIIRSTDFQRRFTNDAKIKLYARYIRKSTTDAVKLIMKNLENEGYIAIVPKNYMRDTYGSYSEGLEVRSL